MPHTRLLILAALCAVPITVLAHWDNLSFNHETGVHQKINPLMANREDLDTNLDNYITIDEAIDFTHRVFETWDSNGDMVLEPDEFPLKSKCGTSFCTHYW